MWVQRGEPIGLPLAEAGRTLEADDLSGSGVRKEYMTNTTLRDRLGISKGNYSVASRIIRDTLKENLIKIQDPEGEGRGAED